MADVNEALIKEAIRRAEEEKAKKEAEGAAEAVESEENEAAAVEAADEAGQGSEEAADSENEINSSEDGDASTDNETSDGGKADGKKINLFSKKDKKDKRDEQIAALNAQVEELNDKLVRNLAEFQNFRNRSEKEKDQRFEMGASSVVAKLLETIDNFERGLATVPEDKQDDPFVQGMDKTYKSLMSTLEGLGVKPIEAVGQEFDPNLHNAVMHVEDENFGENIVCEEFQKGYMYRDSVVRHSMVKVAN